MLIIDHKSAERLGGAEGIATAVNDFTRALLDHSKTIGVPAPTSEPIIEAIVRQHGGEFTIEPDDAPVAQEAPPSSADNLRLAAIKANTRRVNIISYFNAHTDIEILAYVAANSNTLAKAQVMLGDIALILAAAVRD